MNLSINICELSEIKKKVELLDESLLFSEDSQLDPLEDPRVKVFQHIIELRNLASKYLPTMLFYRACNTSLRNEMDRLKTSRARDRNTIGIIMEVHHDLATAIAVKSRSFLKLTDQYLFSGIEAEGKALDSIASLRLGPVKERLKSAMGDAVEVRDALCHQTELSIYKDGMDMHNGGRVLWGTALCEDRIVVQKAKRKRSGGGQVFSLAVNEDVYFSMIEYSNAVVERYRI